MGSLFLMDGKWRGFDPISRNLTHYGICRRGKRSQFVFLGERFVKNSTKRGTHFPMYDWENERSARGKSGNRTGFTKRMQEAC